VLKPELSDVFRDIHSGDTADKWQAAREWKRAGGEKKRGRRVRTFRGLNLGVGVQSTAVYILAHDAALWGPHPLEFAFFADTGEEPDAVYRHLEYLQTHFTIPIQVVSKGKLGDDLVNGTNGHGVAPIKPTNGTNGNAPAKTKGKPPTNGDAP